MASRVFLVQVGFKQVGVFIFMAVEFVVTLATQQQVKSAFTGDFLKGHQLPRVLFVGRSNVGKSSLINLLCGTTLARVSSEPGKTRALHVYRWKEGACLVVDLPGYGYAKASKEDRDTWSSVIGTYLETDPKIRVLCLLIDGRHDPSALDREAYEFLNTGDWKIIPVLTKWDQLKNQADRARQKKRAREILHGWGFTEPTEVWVSSKTKFGIPELKRKLLEESRSADG